MCVRGSVCIVVLGVVLGFWVRGLFWGKGPNWVFGVWDLIGVLRGPYRGLEMNLELPRGMSATTLPGGKYPYGICQNREEWGARECLLVEVG